MFKTITPNQTESDEITLHLAHTTALTLSYLATIDALSEDACANNTLSSTLKLCSALSNTNITMAH